LREDDFGVKNGLENILQSVCTIDDRKIDFAIPANLKLEDNLVKDCKMLLKQSKIMCANF